MPLPRAGPARRRGAGRPPCSWTSWSDSSRRAATASRVLTFHRVAPAGPDVTPGTAERDAVRASPTCSTPSSAATPSSSWTAVLSACRAAGPRSRPGPPADDRRRLPRHRRVTPGRSSASVAIPAVLFVPTAYPDAPDRTFWWDRLHRAVVDVGGADPGAAGRRAGRPDGRAVASRRLPRVPRCAQGDAPRDAPRRGRCGGRGPRSRTGSIGHPGLGGPPGARGGRAHAGPAQPDPSAPAAHRGRGPGRGDRRLARRPGPGDRRDRPGLRLSVRGGLRRRRAMPSRQPACAWPSRPTRGDNDLRVADLAQAQPRSTSRSGTPGPLIRAQVVR